MHCKKNFRISADISALALQTVKRNAEKIKKARFGNFTKRGEIKPTYPQADCGYERKKPYSAGFVLGRPVTRVTVLIEPRLRKRSMRSKRLRTLRFLEDAEPPLLKLLCWDIILSFYKINKTPY